MDSLDKLLADLGLDNNDSRVSLIPNAQTNTQPEPFLQVEHVVDPTIEDEPHHEPQSSPTGVLSTLATGAISPSQAAAQLGISEADLESQLGTALRQLSKDDIESAIGKQVSIEQLKSGALYGFVLSTIINDLNRGAMKPNEKLELLKTLAKLGKIEPKESAGASGTGFSLTINMGDSGQKPIVLEAESV